MADLEALGFLFESLVVRDLRIYGQASQASVYHYRDSDKLEVDAIVEGTRRAVACSGGQAGRRRRHRAGRPVAVAAARQGGRLTDACASKLLIITAAGYGYDRPDGTTVLPITALGV